MDASVRSANEFIWQENESDTAVYQIVYSEASMAMVFREGVNSKLFVTAVADPDYLVFPVFLFGVKFVFNRQITPSLLLDASFRLVLEMSDLMFFILGVITDWTDPRLLRFNPQLASMFNAHNIYVAPITLILSCKSIQRGKIGHFVNVAMAQFLPEPAMQLEQLADSDIDLCKFNVFEAAPGVTTVTITHESMTAKAVAEVIGGFGLQWFEGTTPQELAPIDIMLDGTVRSFSTSSMAACATDTLNSDLTLLAFKSKDTRCWPFTQTIYSVSARTYSSSLSGPSSCQSGRLSVSYILSLLSDDKKDPALEAAGIVRLGSIPSIINAALGRTESLYQIASCDGEPLLTRPAVEWKIDVDLQRLAYLLGAIGVILSPLSLLFVSCFGFHRFGTLIRKAIVRSNIPSVGLSTLALSTLGIVLLSSSIFTLVVPDSAYSCSAITWLICLGASMLSIPLFVHTLNRYITYMTAGRSRLSSFVSATTVAVACSIDVLLLLIWQLVSPREPQTVQDDNRSSPTLYTICVQPALGLGFHYTFMCVKCALLLAGCGMSWALRHSVEHQSIGRVWPILSITVAVTQIVAHIVGDLSGNGGIAVRVFAVAFAVTATWSLLYVPLFVRILYRNRFKPIRKHRSILRNSINQIDHPSKVPLSFDFPPLRVMDEDMLVAYITALDGEIAQTDKALQSQSTKKSNGQSISSQHLPDRLVDQVNASHQHIDQSSNQPVDRLVDDVSQDQNSHPLERVSSLLTSPDLPQRQFSGRFDSIIENPKAEMTNSGGKLPLISFDQSPEWVAPQPSTGHQTVTNHRTILQSLQYANQMSSPAANEATHRSSDPFVPTNQESLDQLPMAIETNPAQVEQQASGRSQSVKLDDSSTGLALEQTDNRISAVL